VDCIVYTLFILFWAAEHNGNFCYSVCVIFRFLTISLVLSKFIITRTIQP